ncbi:hypothetical protein [Nocardia barduliensis]|uniref:hypothetical protein n=1 Tax=Nocardia barduliensis TaxID=2736643 RepID=UPI001574C6CF|nr:hypothetical protein [Nocardia barduliensis]
MVGVEIVRAQREGAASAAGGLDMQAQMVIPSQSPLQERVHRPLVTNRVVRSADEDLAFGIRSIGDGGRIRGMITSLRWTDVQVFASS